jgi:hypothetical protein
MFDIRRMHGETEFPTIFVFHSYSFGALKSSAIRCASLELQETIRDRTFCHPLKPSRAKVEPCCKYRLWQEMPSCRAKDLAMKNNFLTPARFAGQARVRSAGQWGDTISTARTRTRSLKLGATHTATERTTCSLDPPTMILATAFLATGR